MVMKFKYRVIVPVQADMIYSVVIDSKDQAGADTILDQYIKDRNLDEIAYDSELSEIWDFDYDQVNIEKK